MLLVQAIDEREASYVVYTETVESLSNREAQSLTEEMIGLTMNKLYPISHKDNDRNNEAYIIDNKKRERFAINLFHKPVFYN